MKTLRNIFAAAMLLLTTTAMADNFAFLNIEQQDGANSFQVSQISKITFDASDMVLHLTTGGEQRLPLASLQKMFFSEQGVQGIANVSADEGKISLTGGQLRLQVAEGEKAIIFNAKGEQVYTTNRSGVVQIDNLRKGIYIVRVGAATKKVMTK